MKKAPAPGTTDLSLMTLATALSPSLTASLVWFKTWLVAPLIKMATDLGFSFSVTKVNFSSPMVCSLVGFRLDGENGIGDDWCQHFGDFLVHFRREGRSGNFGGTVTGDFVLSRSSTGNHHGGRMLDLHLRDPVIRPDDVLISPGVDHRLNGEHHAWLHDPRRLVAGIVGDLRSTVEQFPNPVANEGSNNRTTVSLGVLFNDIT
ncbi:hypothetical protein WICPIJ_005771 [Wickerhamomyces pijperi]|uniref:Uncharacterized protein n=1 Tax=Wickerhamomyces pijperi TaxID=599730 RepID=A0A9P8Q3B5_WICPI|nr:hypothetical protein WICPIJ_005771 [Wickerhamomyces pijperi]